MPTATINAVIVGWEHFIDCCLACRFALIRRPFAAGAGRLGELSGFQTVFQDLVEIVSVGFLGALDHVDNPFDGGLSLFSLDLITTVDMAPATQFVRK